jgi:tetratricopeptide (TPR) repeat protein
VTGRPFSAEDRVALEAERDFLLASIRDLDEEHERGELADDRYAELVSGYTARSARVLRALDEMAPHDRAEATAEQTPRRHQRRRLVLVPLGAALVAAAALLPTALSERRAGQTITGNAQNASAAPAELADAVRQRPDDPAAHRAYARYLLDAGELVEALEHYDDVARLDPDDAESRAYAGWIVHLAGLTDDALQRVDDAVAVDPTYPDAHFFRGMILAQGRAQPSRAAAELRRYLELAPDTPFRGQVEEVLAELEATRRSDPPTTEQ